MINTFGSNMKRMASTNFSSENSSVQDLLLWHAPSAPKMAGPQRMVQLWLDTKKNREYEPKMSNWFIYKCKTPKEYSIIGYRSFQTSSSCPSNPMMHLRNFFKSSEKPGVA